MANVDRPNGFIPVGTLSGAPVSGLIRAIGVTDAADMFVGDALNLASGLAAVAASNDAAFLGVAVGFGKKVNGVASMAYNAADLNTRYYDDSANTHTDWVVFYAPADDVIFEVQTATALTKLPGDTMDLSATAGSTTTGNSLHEATTSSAADLTVIAVPQLVDNVSTEVWGRYHVMFTRAEQAFHA